MPSTYHFIFSYTKAGARAECQIGEDRTHTFNFFFWKIYFCVCACWNALPQCLCVWKLEDTFRSRFSHSAVRVGSDCVFTRPMHFQTVLCLCLSVC